MTRSPWASVPPSLAEVLRPALPGLADEITDAIRAEVAEYAQPLEGAFGRTVRGGVDVALRRFLDLIERPEQEDPADRRVYVELGRGEFRQGRSLDALLAAYRVGARVSWRRYVQAGKEAGVEPDVLYQLGEAIFAYIDGLSAESIEGYTQAQSAEAGERQRLRRQLVELLSQDPPPEPRAAEAAAELAGWPLPATLAALVVAGGRAERLAARLGTAAVVAEVDGGAVALVADPPAPGRRAQIERAAGDRASGLGPEVPWPAAALSARRARLALQIASRGLVVADEHLPELLLHADPPLARDLAQRALAPLEALSPGPRAKLRHTLRVWLDHRGRVEEVAHALAVHPQTVRYRLNQLRELFGDALEDPDGRFALALALRAATPPGRPT